MNLAQLLEEIKRMPRTAANITAWKVLPAQPGRYAPFPPGLPPLLREALRQKGIDSLYSHQARALEVALQRQHVAVVTPAASGKTMCYNLPVLTSLLEDPETRALYLFPTKALAQDQLAELHELVRLLDRDIRTYTYDGDTPTTARQAIRASGHIVVTNPDMLHTGILPHHTKWLKLFSNLRYVVIDEMHNFRGVFGSHLANVIRRLKRVCRFYGSQPCFILCSATIANPSELAERLIEEPVVLIEDNGAPRGEKHFIFYNPPLVNRELGIRRSSLLEGASWARLLLANDVQTITFTRTRLSVEVLLRYMREHSRNPRGVQAYRGGYLPLERRRIEQ
ncbi:MAG TPA: DEAD/DEAH box helicase, partial [Firmicutes bacterium]|nr:DEAD/DEAH box helicase [Bacillota bacterium]